MPFCMLMWLEGDSVAETPDEKQHPTNPGEPTLFLWKDMVCSVGFPGCWLAGIVLACSPASLAKDWGGGGGDGAMAQPRSCIPLVMLLLPTYLLQRLPWDAD